MMNADKSGCLNAGRCRGMTARGLCMPARSFEVLLDNTHAATAAVRPIE